MANFPLFIDLKEKKVLVVGGGQIALGKIQVLLSFEPDLRVVSPEACETLQGLMLEQSIPWFQRRYAPSDLVDVAMVIAATSDSEVNRQIYEDCRSLGILINVVDEPELCQFIFPSIVRRGELVIGISTSGHYPALSKAIRKQLEAQFPAEYEALLNRLGHFRREIYQIYPEFKVRKRILTTVVQQLMSESQPSLARLEEIIEHFRAEGEKEA